MVTDARLPDYGGNATTRSFDHRFRINGDNMSHAVLRVLDMYGSRFNHTDANPMIRTG